jgi:flagellar hook-associated protein 3 FlgL
MRITTANAFDATVDSLQKRQSDMAAAQTRLTAGKRVLVASDDPTAAARAERALATQVRSDAQQRALDASKNSMTLTESALANAGDLLQQIRETLVDAGNASYSDSERASLADKIAGLRTQLLAVANTSDGAGGYLFGGQGTTQPPFADTTSGVQYRGASGQVQVALPEQLPLTLDGAGSWMQARTGNGVFVTAPASTNTGSAWIDSGSVTDPSQLTGSGYTVTFSVSGGATTYSVTDGAGNPTPLVNVPYQSGKSIEIDGQSYTVTGAPADGDAFTSTPSTPTQSVFDVLDKAIADLKTPLRNTGQIQQGVDSGIRDLDQSMSALSGLRSQAGQILNLADSTESRIGAQKLYGKTEESNATDLDMVQAISDFQNQQSGYSAALQTYATVQKMSLFNYING